MAVFDFFCRPLMRRILVFVLIFFCYFARAAVEESELTKKTAQAFTQVRKIKTDLFEQQDKNEIQKSIDALKTFLGQKLKTDKGESTLLALIKSTEQAEIKNLLLQSANYVQGETVTVGDIGMVEEAYRRTPFDPQLLGDTSLTEKNLTAYEHCYLGLGVFAEVTPSTQDLKTGSLFDFPKGPVAVPANRAGRKGLYLFFREDSFEFLDFENLKSARCLIPIEESNLLLAFGLIEAGESNRKQCEIKLNQKPGEPERLFAHCGTEKSGRMPRDGKGSCNQLVDKKNAQKLDEAALQARRVALISMIENSGPAFKGLEDSTKTLISSRALEDQYEHPELMAKPHPQKMVDLLQMCEKIPDEKVKDAARKQIKIFESQMPIDPSESLNLRPRKRRLNIH